MAVGRVGARLQSQDQSTGLARWGKLANIWAEQAVCALRPGSSGGDGLALMQRYTTASFAASFDSLVGGHEERRRDGETKRLGGLEVDHQLEFFRRQDRHLRRIGTFEDFARVAAGLS
jgi:hypothetical protein